MIDKTLDEWIAIYEQKTGEVFKPHPSFKLLYFPDRGFCEIGLDQKAEMVMAYQLCGDGHYWKSVLDSIAKLIGYGHGGTICTRHIKAYIRYWGFRIKQTIRLENGLEQYFCEDKYGVQARCSPAWENKDGTHAYFVTWEIKEGG